MHIVFGMQLDGLVAPEIPNYAAYSINSLVVGPQGFLSLLEQKLGLGYPDSAQPERVAQYIGRLEEFDTGSRFYSASFAVDRWATAQRVLEMRDALAAHPGFAKQQFPPGCRLATVSEIENLDSRPLAPGQSDRIRDVLSALKRARRMDIKHIQLATPKYHLPQVWIKILALLAKLGTLVGEPLVQPQASHGTDLYSVQQAMLAGTPNPVVGDHSLVRLDSSDEIEAAETVAEWLASDKKDNSNVAIIRGNGSTILDELNSALGLPRIGSQCTSRLRGALQVLPLLFELSWEPLNPARLLELLSLPGSPIPASVSRFFLEALREQAGTGGECWRQAYSKIRELRRSRHQEQYHEPTVLDKMIEREVALWRSWLEPERFSPVEGITSAAALRLCEQIEQWAVSNASIGKQEKLIVCAATAARTLASIIQTLETERISRVQIDRILDSVLIEGAKNEAGGAEASEWSVVDSPGQIWSSVDTVLWFDFVKRDSLVKYVAPWQPEEIEILKGLGITLETQMKSVIREAASWRLPILHAQRRVLLVSPRLNAGDCLSVHPVWGEIEALVDEPARLNFDGNRSYFQGKTLLCGREICRQEVVQRGVRLPPVVWEIRPGLVKPRETESSSSVERLLGCPLSWCFEYAAKLYPGAMQVLPDDERLFANIAHAAVDKLLSEQKRWQPDEARDRVEQVLTELVESIGPQLLAPGKATELYKRCSDLKHSFGVLISLINSAQLEIVGCELQRSREFGEAKFNGVIDLLLRDVSGRHIVLDLKWTKWHRYKQRQLAEGRAIQLAAYAWLQSTEESAEQVLGAGYFMLRQAELYYSQLTPFPEDCFVEGNELDILWERVVQKHRVSVGQMTEGHAVASGITDKIEVDPSDAVLVAPPCRICSYGKLCGKELTDLE